MDVPSFKISNVLHIEPPTLKYTLIMKYENMPSYPEMFIPVKADYMNEDLIMYSVNIDIEDYM